MGFVGRLKTVEAVRLHELAGRDEVAQVRVEAARAALKLPFRVGVVTSLRPWAEQYTVDLLRYKFLVLRGGSRTGKSTLAKSLGELFNWLGPYVQTVQGAPAPDLKEFKRETHGYVLFDNVNSMEFVLGHRALFQSNNSIHTLGLSQTGIYSYRVWLHRIPIVVTVDDSAVWDSTEAWLSQNIVEVVLDGPCYEG